MEFGAGIGVRVGPVALVGLGAVVLVIAAAAANRHADDRRDYAVSCPPPVAPIPVPCHAVEPRWRRSCAA